MNCPTRDSNPLNLDGFNQNPPYLAPELTTRSSLVCGGKSDGTYNLSLHVLALFIVLFQSILSCSFPLIVKRFPQLRVPRQFLFLSRHFGTGVLIATAFVHLLPTAFTSLTDPCLPSFWNKGYPAMAGLIAMVAVFVVVSIEMIFSSMNGGAMGGCHSGPGGIYDPLAPSPPQVEERSGAEEEIGTGLSGTVTGGQGTMMSTRPRHQRSTSIGIQLQKIEKARAHADLDAIPSSSTEDLSADTDQLLRNDDGVYDEALSDTEDEDRGNHEPDTRAVNRRARSQSNASSRHKHNIGSRLTEAQQQQKNLLQVMLLEAGILFHSVFIGMALSVATGSNFIVLLIAITFHQTFEGLALGSRIAGLKALDKGSWKPWLMCLAYGTTTPIGQAIGLATRKLYDPASQTGLLMVGIMNAISSGLLLFAGLVELLAEDFLSDESYVVLTGKRRFQACGAVAAGGFGMALIGAWA
ncbi:Zinc/iron permease [Choiromyces venosus 120613-1]|uniref:Zinc/iron permease n=1 Tax=Choiromyces venosus 120613-1 TaxID=1336337 RepID=A0A3N4JD43_9PEZI|nr:Zinc/iron permease [Choiromyces venosus 120613-1]